MSAMGLELDKPVGDPAETSARQTALSQTESFSGIGRAPYMESPAAIGRYTIQRQIGKGGFGSVYLARDAALEREVAIKVTAPVKRHREARTLARLDHPAIVPVYDIGELPSGESYIVAKFVRGSSLAERLAIGRMPMEDAVRIAARVCDGLHHAHLQHIYHRDVKPANILLDNDGAALVADFGLAIMEQDQPAVRGEISGSPGYMSPEQIRGDAHLLDGRTDIWSVGVVLYEMLAGERPFSAASRDEIFELVLHKEPKPLRLVDPAIPIELERIVLRCLRKEVADRYATAADVAKDLRAWLDARRAPEKTSNRSLWIAAGLCAAFASFGLWQWMTRRQPASIAIPPGGSVHLVEAPLAGTISLRIWSPENLARRGRRLEEPGMLPLQAADQIRVEAELSRPAYAYILWIDGQGKVTPVYPWQPGKWDARPANETKVTHVSLPEQADSGWEIEPTQGMETLLLIVRDEPLGADVHLEKLLADLPSQARQDARALAWFDDGRAVAEELRAPRFFDPKKIDDPVVATHQALRERLAPIATSLRAVTFASPGE
jgi:hypothetical protein